jgi:hypothetical protein
MIQAVLTVIDYVYAAVSIAAVSAYALLVVQ